MTNHLLTNVKSIEREKINALKKSIGGQNYMGVLAEVTRTNSVGGHRQLRLSTA